MRLITARISISILIFISAFISGCSRPAGAPTLAKKHKYQFDRDRKATIFSNLDKQLRSYLGTPYRFGGDSYNGIDCSGLVYAVYRDAAGIELPRQVRYLRYVGYPVNNGRWKLGDLLFFAIKGNRLTHVGIYLGADRFQHVSRSSGTIVSSLDEPYYKKRFRMARRIIR